MPLLDRAEAYALRERPCTRRVPLGDVLRVERGALAGVASDAEHQPSIPSHVGVALPGPGHAPTPCFRTRSSSWSIVSPQRAKSMTTTLSGSTARIGRTSSHRSCPLPQPGARHDVDAAPQQLTRERLGRLANEIEVGRFHPLVFHREGEQAVGRPVVQSVAARLQACAGVPSPASEYLIAASRAQPRPSTAHRLCESSRWW